MRFTKGAARSARRSGVSNRAAATRSTDGWDSPPPIEIPITEIRHDAAKSVLTTNESPDIPHGLSLNPYRGCEHGCVYCFARPSHAYLGLSPGIDFETKIYAKTDAVEILRAELRKPGHRVRPIALGINTDSYQPVERKLKITRAILELLAECRHPVSLITKSALIERDLDILSEMAKSNLVEAAISITSLDNDLTRKLEPRAAAPARRLRTIENLARAGVPVGVMMAPIIPAVTDREIESLLTAAKAAGAGGAGYVVLRLPHELREVFFAHLFSPAAANARPASRKKPRAIRAASAARHTPPRPRPPLSPPNCARFFSTGWTRICRCGRKKCARNCGICTAGAITTRRFLSAKKGKGFWRKSSRSGFARRARGWAWICRAGRWIARVSSRRPPPGRRGCCKIGDGGIAQR